MVVARLGRVTSSKMGLVGKSGHLVIISMKVMKTVAIMIIRMNRMRKKESPY